MTVTSLWVGGLTPGGARVRAKLSGVSSARLAVDTDPHFATPTHFGPATPTTEGMATLNPSGLATGGTYYYAIEQDGVLAPGGLVTDGTAGDYCTTPDDSSLDITGDLDLRAEVTIADWTNAAPDGVRATFIGKWDGSNRSYFLGVEDDGRLALFWSTTGVNSVLRFSTVSVPIASGRLAVRAIGIMNDGGNHTARFFTADAITGAWVQLGADVTNAGTSSIFSGTAEASLAVVDGGVGRPFAGIIHAAQIRNGVDGTVVADPFPAFAPIAAAGFADGTGKTWTMQGDAEILSAMGRFRTHPAPVGAPFSFSFIASGDAGLSPDFPDTTGDVLASARQSNAPTFDTIREHQSSPLFYACLGDICYNDLGSGSHGIVGGGSLSNYRRQLDDVLLQTRQHQLYREVPLVYVWDDHDYGPNNSDGALATKGNAAAVYREKVPSYGLPDSGAIYHSFQVGRVLFVVWDCRFYRSPNGDPDGPSKTMLGSAQKAWFASLLNTSTADAMVVFSSVRWINGSSDSWPGFATERQEIADLLASTGWADRMVMINADVHALAFDSGANNDWGGFPVYVVGSIDATPFDPTPSSYDHGASSARDQYGNFQVDDDGSSVTITAQGYQDDTVLVSHTFVIDTEPEPPEPPGPDPGESLPAGVISPVVKWLSCDLFSGRVIARLQDLETDQISRRIGSHTSSGLKLPIASVGPKHWTLSQRAVLAEQATEPRETMLVAVVNDQPAWAGAVMDRDGGTEAELELPCATLEAYLLHRYVRHHTFVQADEARIAAALLADAGAVLGLGLGIGLEIDAPDTGTPRDREYVDTDNATVYDRLRELMAVRGGPEWTIEVLWGDETRTWVRKVARVRKRIGVAAQAPNAVFRTTTDATFGTRGASAARYKYNERHAGGKGANVIQAYSSGEGEDQPRSDLAVDTAQLAAGVPIWERRFQPASGIKDVATLNEHAQRELELRRNGERTWAIEARWNTYPRLNVDWRIGDDIGWHLFGHRHPAGAIGQGRAVGWTLNPQAGTVRPILLDPSSDGAT